MPRLTDESGELRLPDCVAMGAQGGDEFHTTIVESGSGKEQATQDWKNAKGSWELGYAASSSVENWKTFRAFFRLCCGRYYNFRFKDWTDYQADFDTGVVGLGVGTGEPVLPLGRAFNVAGAIGVELIYKPVPGTLSIKKNGSLLTEGSSAGNWEVDLSQGLIVFMTTVTKNITGISQAASAVVTSASHGFTNGQIVWLSGIGGMTDMNLRAVTVSGATTNTFATGVDTSASDAYTSGGTIKFYPQPSDALTAKFEFDQPVRFDVDKISVRIEGKKGNGKFILVCDSVPIVKIRPR